MKTPDEILSELLARYPQLSACAESLREAYQCLVTCYEHDGILYVCGNGGSCADSDHITGELLKGFVSRRPLPAEECEKLQALAGDDGAMLASTLQCGLRAISLNSHVALTTAVGNDLGDNLGPAQMLQALGRPGDVFLAISTSGNARNLALAGAVAKAKEVKVIGLTGRNGGKLRQSADICICVPEDETYKIQELHLPVYHALCLMLESRFFA
jgi:D-sedoheptulose 7-phosphate isomerase